MIMTQSIARGPERHIARVVHIGHVIEPQADRHDAVSLSRDPTIGMLNWGDANFGTGAAVLEPYSLLEIVQQRPTEEHGSVRAADKKREPKVYGGPS